MKKILAAVMTAAIVITAAGCGNNGKTPESTKDTEKGSGGKITQVAYTAPEQTQEDTTDEALAYLKEHSPLFAKYLETRRDIPLIMETEVTRGDTTVKAGIYIRDKKSVAVSAYDSEGFETRTVYKNGKVYDIHEKEKKVYYSDYDEEKIKKLVKDYSIKLTLGEVSASGYSSGVDTYNGTEYNTEQIVTAQIDAQTGEHRIVDAKYYFDKASGDLRYILSGDSVNEIVSLVNEVKESAFVVPNDYEMVDYAEYINSKAQEAN